MSNLFDLVSEFSGQKNSVSIPRIYIKLCGGDFTTAAVLSQLVFWSSKGKRSDGYFWKSYEDIANELCEDEITVEQVRYAVKKLKTLLCDCFFVEVRRANGITTNHYRFDQLIFLEKLQNLKQRKSLDTVNGKIPNRENSRSGMGKFPDTVNGKIPVPVTDTNHILTTDPNSTSGKDFPPAKTVKKFVYTDDDLRAANWIFGLIKNLSPSNGLIKTNFGHQTFLAQRSYGKNGISSKSNATLAQMLNAKNLLPRKTQVIGQALKKWRGCFDESINNSTASRRKTCAGAGSPNDRQNF